MPAVVLNFGASEPDSPPSSDFEEVPYPYAVREEQLPLYHMEDKARHRRTRAPNAHDGPMDISDPMDVHDDEGKDVYHKLNQTRSGMGGGRVRQQPLPPPTSIVSAAVHTMSLNSASHRAVHSASSSSKTSNTSLPSYTPSSPATRATTK
jgi:hypothetical protein